MNWHLLSREQVFLELKSSEHGLSPEEASRRTEQYGSNELVSTRKKGALHLFFKQFLDIMVIVLLIAVGISVFVKEFTDAIVIFLIIILNVLIGFIQEFRAGKAIEALKSMENPLTLVVRGGITSKIKSADLVPGDMVIFEAGTKVPADLRLTDCFSLKVDESSLTGESVPADKINAELKYNSTGPGDRPNMAFKGTYVTYGRGKGIVTATGMETELGRIAGMLQEKEPLTPLQIRMTDFSRKLTLIIVFICMVLFLTGFLRGNSAVEMLLLSLSVAVAAIPEALPAVITISLALGAKRLAKGNALIRRLYAVETLGSVSFICSDKTGTLTQNKMEVAEIWVPGTEEQKVSFLKAMQLNHDVSKKGDELFGDPTEVALILYVQEQLNQKTDWQKEHKRVDEIPFDSDRKVMTTIHAHHEGHLVVTKGAVESVTAICSGMPSPDELNTRIEIMTRKGLRVMAYAYNVIEDLPKEVNPATVEREMKFLGLAGLVDPPREEVKQAILECKTAGITPVMITGDHPVTAEAIAKELGIKNSNEDILLTGSELAAMPQAELERKIEKIKVYARVSPAQKLDIVKALQKKGHFIAMTGDGVNDAPSLKMANIGIAMGITGTDVTKEAAQMILLDDNFATIVKAVEQGRRIYDNIRKFIYYIMAGNTAELFVILLAPILGLPLALLPVQILWINLVTDGLPALALAAEPAERNIMKKKPRKAGENIFAGNLGKTILATGFLIGFITLASQQVFLSRGHDSWQTMVFTILCFSQLWHVLAIRSETETLLKRGILSNQYLLAAVLLTVALQLCLIYLPGLRIFFHTSALSAGELLLTVLLSSIIFWVIEIRKALRLRNFQNNVSAISLIFSSLF